MNKWGDHYQKIRKIGQGSSAQIYLVVKKDSKQQMAAKIVKNIEDEAQISALEMEIKILSNSKHPNLVKCYGVQLFEGEVWILMQYCEQGSLSDIMHKRKVTYTEQQISAILQQLLEGLQYLHHKNIIHRDIKASNILYHRGSIKIADFGISIISQGSALQPKFSRMGSPFWMSPEILSESSYNHKSDIWALGITAIELAQGQPPYSHQHPFRAIYSIQTHPPQGLKYPQKWSKEFNDFIRLCLMIDHTQRPTAQQLLTHAFISKGQRLQQKSPQKLQILPQIMENFQDTIIMHDQQPLSVWQKGSFPQTQMKLNENAEIQDTVVIKQTAEESLLLFSEFKNQQLISLLKDQSQKQNNRINTKIVMSTQQREKKVKQLYLMMQDEVKSIRRKYMQKISQLYVAKQVKVQEKAWNSPIKKLKQKNQFLFTENSRSTSEVFKKML